LSGILALPECQRMKVIAGSGGLDRQVEWFETVESAGRLDSLEPGDLVFVAGNGWKSGVGLAEFAAACDQREMAGLVFLTGGLIEQIPEAVIRCGEERALPILELPAQIGLAGVQRALGRYLLERNSEKMTIHQFLEKIFSGELSSEGYDGTDKLLERLGLRDGVRYQVGVYRLQFDEDADKRAFRIVRQELVEKVSGILPTAQVVVPVEDGAVSLAWERDGQALQGENLSKELRRISLELEEANRGMTVRAGLSSACEEVRRLGECCRKARAVARFVRPDLQKERLIYQYGQLGLVRLIMECSDRTFLEEFKREYFDALDLYDRLNNTDLCAFLELYYQCDCSVKKVSEMAYLHKNTVLYKLKKIEGILHCDFGNTDDLLNIRTALLIRGVIGGER